MQVCGQLDQNLVPKLFYGWHARLLGQKYYGFLESQQIIQKMFPTQLLFIRQIQVNSLMQ